MSKPRKNRAFLPRRIRRSCAAAVLAATTLIIGGLQAVPAHAASTTVVSLTFDNQWASQMTAATDMQAAGMAGTFYTISGWIGLSGFMSLSNLQTLAAAGDEIGGKTVYNTDLPTVSNAEAQRQICLGRDVLLRDGFHVTDFAYPFADLNSAVETLVKTCGFNSGRGVGNINPGNSETVPGVADVGEPVAAGAGGRRPAGETTIGAALGTESAGWRTR